MRFQQLQENLRKLLAERIESGQLTGLRLAHDTGYQQAHVSNFLNHKRGLSLEGMDRVLAAQKLSILDLLDAAEINKRASIAPPSDDSFENVLLVESETAANDVLVTSEKVRDILKFKRTFLKRLRPEMQTSRDHWTRFVLIRMGQEAMSMYPRILPGANVLIDRHYNSLKPYRRNEPNMYAVRKDRRCTIKYIEISGNNLILRPHNQAYPVDLLPVPADASYTDFIIGRICYVGIET